MRSFLRRGVAVPFIAALAFFACGGGGGGSGKSFSVTFTESATALAPRTVKLVQKSKSGARVVVDAVIGGPDVSLDLYSFAFDVKIGNPSVLKFVPGSGTAGDALVAFAGQTIQVQAGTLTGDASDVVCGVTKSGGGTGNGIAGSSAVVLELAFDVQKAGTTTLTITGYGATPPAALDSGGVAIGSITFDALPAGVQGISN